MSGNGKVISKAQFFDLPLTRSENTFHSGTTATAPDVYNAVYFDAITVTESIGDEPLRFSWGKRTT